MKGIMDLLVAARLVTLDEEEPIAREMAVTPAETPAVDDPAPPPPQQPPPPEIPEFPATAAPGASFEQIYREADIPPSPFPAERLLRLLDGLRAMDEATRRAAVRAMDEADENWNIDDPVLDAQRKIRALDAFCQALDLQWRELQEQTAAEVAGLREQQESAGQAIRKQISELEKLLEREMQKTAEKIATLETECSTLQVHTDGEKNRIKLEIARLGEISAQFGQASNQP